MFLLCFNVFLSCSSACFCWVSRLTLAVLAIFLYDLAIAQNSYHKKVNVSLVLHFSNGYFVLSHPPSQGVSTCGQVGPKFPFDLHDASNCEVPQV